MNNGDIVRTNASTITYMHHPLASIWIAREDGYLADFFYGGTRLVAPDVPDSAVKNMLLRLMTNESASKNRLINHALTGGAVQHLHDRLPAGFMHSRVGGARCLIRPHSAEIYSAISHQHNPRNVTVTVEILACLGDLLNKVATDVKLTPDFGRFANLADTLHRYTENVLGIACEKGGCGGKSSYATTGLVAAAEYLENLIGNCDDDLTLIGSAGAMGYGVLAHYQHRSNIAVCDLAYDEEASVEPPDGVAHLYSIRGKFSPDCLSRGGMIIATTLGDELENSEWHTLPAGTLLLLGHNLSMPIGQRGIDLARSIKALEVSMFPGQALTFGGALTARLEWYWRQLPDKPIFDKPLAHDVVRAVSHHIVKEVARHSQEQRVTPHEAVLHFSNAT